MVGDNSTEIRQIALYGKGGIGKSTVASNVAVAAQQRGRKCMLVGCSPKGDSTTFLLGGEPPDYNILELTREKGNSEDIIMQAIVKGSHGIYCVESGGPEPAEGCAGRGNALALDLIKQHKIKEKFGVDFVIYDVIGDVVCGGFAQPMRAGYAQEVYIVCSGELMAMYSANNICIAISDLKKRGAQVGVAGIICNMRNIEKERDLVEEFAGRISVPVIAYIPRDRIVQDAESNGCTVVEYVPNHPQAKVYQSLAEDIIVNRSPEKVVLPTPIELEDVMQLTRKYNIEG